MESATLRHSVMTSNVEAMASSPHRHSAQHIASISIENEQEEGSGYEETINFNIVSEEFVSSPFHHSTDYSLLSPPTSRLHFDVKYESYLK